MARRRRVLKAAVALLLAVGVAGCDPEAFPHEHPDGMEHGCDVEFGEDEDGDGKVPVKETCW